MGLFRIGFTGRAVDCGPGLFVSTKLMSGGGWFQSLNTWVKKQKALTAIKASVMGIKGDHKMKKLLLGSTALMAAGALLASPAAAEEPISLGVGGYMQSFVTFTDQDVGSTDYNPVRVRNEGEVHFTGSTTLDNGLTIGVNIQLEARTTNAATMDQIDEHFVYFSGDWGRVNVGAENSAPYLMGYGAPAAGLGVNSPTFRPFTTSGSGPTNNFITGLSDNNKLTYFTPRFSGFQLGVSYTPEDNNNNGAGLGGGLATDDDEDDNSNYISLGANFVESFNGVDVAVSGGYERGDLEADADNTHDDREAWHVGLNIGFSGFTVGGSYGSDNNGLAGSQDTSGWDIGATYSTGPWGVGVTYWHGEQELAAGGDDEDDLIELGVNYALGPGITIVGALQYYDEDNNVATDTDGIAVSIGSKLSF